MANKAYYTYQKIAAPDVSAASLKSFTRKINDQLEALTMKVYGNVEAKDLHTSTTGIIIDATLNSTRYVHDLAEKAGLGDLTHVGSTAPDNPAVNDVWLDISVVPNRFMRWTGFEWMEAGGSASLSALASLVDTKNTIYYRTTAPTSPNEGDVWYDTDAAPVVVYRRVSGSWVNITTETLSAALDAAGNAQAIADSKIRTFSQASAPTGMVPGDVGDLWVDTDDSNKLYRYSGSAWVAVQDTHNDALVSAHGTAISTLNSAVGAKTTIFYQTSAPTATATGDVWYDTDAVPVVISRWNGTSWQDITTAALSAALSAAGTAQATADGKVRSFAQTTAPTGMVADDAGDLWIDTDDSNKLYRYSGSAWVAVQDTHNDALVAAHGTAISTLNTTVGAKTTIFYQTSQPTATATGDIWYDTDASPITISRWSGTAWVDITTTALSQALTAASTAQSTADGKINSYSQTTAPTGMTASDVGDLWIDTDDNNKLYRYSGSAWVAVQDTHNDALVSSHSTAIATLNTTVGAKTTIFYQTSQPTATATGDIWYDTDASPIVIYRWSGSAWVDITSTALSQALTAASSAQATADGKINSYSQTTAPTGMVASDVGDLWIDTDDSNKLYRYSGSAWVAVQDTHNDTLVASHTTAISTLNTAVGTKTTIFYQTAQPTANVTGDVWYDTDAVPVTIKRWSGTAWVDITSVALSQALTAASTAQSTADGKINSYAQTTAPTGMVASDVGDLWIDTDDSNKLYRYSGSAWVAVQDAHNDSTLASHTTSLATLASAVSAKTTVFYQAAQPTATATGDVWYDTDAVPVAIYRWSSTAWVDITSVALAQALAAAGTAQAAADGKVRTFAQTTAPTGMVAGDVGDLWIDTDDNNKLYRYTGAIWAAVTDTHNDSTLNTLMGQIPSSSLTNGDLRTLLESVSHNVDGILLTGLGGILQLVLGPYQITFKESGATVAYITGQLLNINNAEIKYTLRFGPSRMVTTTNGYLVR